MPDGTEIYCRPVSWPGLPPGRVDILGFSDDEEGLRIIFGFWNAQTESPTAKGYVTFDNYFEFRAKDEGFRLMDVALASDAFRTTPIVIVENSPLSRHVVETAAGTVNPEWLTHYLLASENMCVDVVVGLGVEPKIQS